MKFNACERTALLLTIQTGCYALSNWNFQMSSKGVTRIKNFVFENFWKKFLKPLNWIEIANGNISFFVA